MIKGGIFQSRNQMDENSNLARGPKTKKIYEANMITSHLEVDEYQSEEELEDDNYSMDSGDSQYGDPALEYWVPREQPKPRAVKRDVHYRDINKRYDFKCYALSSKLFINKYGVRVPWNFIW
jgi:hypothetical protein